MKKVAASPSETAGAPSPKRFAHTPPALKTSLPTAQPSSLHIHRKEVLPALTRSIETLAVLAIRRQPCQTDTRTFEPLRDSCMSGEV